MSFPRGFLWMGLACLGLAACGEDPCVAWEADVTECYDAYCDADGAGNAFCTCWDQGMDLDMISCECMPLDLAGACAEAGIEDYESGDLDCDAASAALGHICTY
ncbi:MAG: hypothetical protein JXB39_15575 [Deltaproteobacteria bacterium]|nr:hypothetical protein [Deltaproteobacteria bacterium]